MAEKPAIIFDLDGTLIDSAPDLRAALNRVLTARGLAALSADAVRDMIGDGARVLVTRKMLEQLQLWHAMGARAGRGSDRSGGFPGRLRGEFDG
jgi:phosphoglycolate phosphatase-like HAD superfamily hydrolase